MRRTLYALTAGFGLLALSGAALAGSAESSVDAKADMNASAGQKLDLPATKHQEQVLEGTVPDEERVSPLGDTVKGMPATRHQEQVLSEDADPEIKTQTQ